MKQPILYILLDENWEEFPYKKIINLVDSKLGDVVEDLDGNLFKVSDICNAEFYLIPKQ